MKEIECIILEINKEEIIAKLESLGAKKLYDETLESAYFKHPSGNERDYVRIRKIGDKTFLTAKIIESQAEAKIQEEQEIEVSDFDTTVKLLEQLGLKLLTRAKKHRISYRLGNVNYELDKYKDEWSKIPDFMELEGTSIEEIHGAAKKLGFSKEDCKPWGAQNLRKHYQELL